MEEEIKNPELEKVTKEISNNFSNKPHLKALVEIFGRGGGTVIKSGSIGDACYINKTDKTVEFYGEYREKVRSLSDFKPLIDFLDRENYRWI